MHLCPLEEVGNHSCSMHFRPDSSTPQTLHLGPGTIRDIFYMVIIKDAPQRVEINVDFFISCSGIAREGSVKYVIGMKEISS